MEKKQKHAAALGPRENLSRWLIFAKIRTVSHKAEGPIA